MNSHLSSDDIKQLLQTFSEVELSSPYAVEAFSNTIKEFRDMRKQEDLDSLNYYCYRLKRLSEADRQELITMIIEEEDCSHEVATKQVDELKAVTTAEILSHNLNVPLLEAMWCDDMQKDQNAYIYQQLAAMSNSDIDKLADLLLADEISAEVHDVSTRDQATAYLKELRSQPDVCHDLLFFQLHFNYFKQLSTSL